MTRRALLTFIFFISGIRLVVGFGPDPAVADSETPTQDPTNNPAPSDSPSTAVATPAATPSADPSVALVTPAPTKGPKPTPKPTATPQPTATPTSTSTPAPTATPVATLHDGTYIGSNYNYSYGNMKVTVTITNGKVTSASTVQTGSYAIGFQSRGCTEAVFNSAAINLAAGSSAYANYLSLKPSACSGATFSWKGYGHSLQAAIDKATY
jgi:uncharacterized protein with FMN-binding domain